MIFISCSFDPYPKALAKWIRQSLADRGIDAYISRGMEAKPLPEHLRERIHECEALLAVLTEEKCDWVQNEIAIAYSVSKPVYAVVKEGLEVEGILPHITVYETFDPGAPQSLGDSIDRLESRVRKSRKDEAISGIFKLILTGLGIWFLARE